LLEDFGHTVQLIDNGLRALHTVRAHPPDLVLLDVRLPGMDGYAVCTALKHDPATWDIPVIMVTVDVRREGQLRGIEAEVDAYLQKPVDGAELEARVRVLLRAKRRSEQLERAEDVIFALARAVEAKDAYTEGHLHRMAGYAVAIGERLGLSDQDLLALRYGALLHDVGKVGIDETIIRKDGPLTSDEFELMRQHPLIGARIVQPLRLAAMVGPIVRYHHECWNGGGYPDRLSGEQIPLGARIVAVADSFDAMTTQRPYNQVFSFAEAAELLRAGAGHHWDPQVVTVFLDWLEETHAVTLPLLSREVGG
jgi:putative two-component system response regulator